MMKRQFLFLAIMLFGTFTNMLAQSLQLNSSYWQLLERGRQWNQQFQCYTPAFAYDFHLNLNLYGVRGQNVTLIIYFEQPKGTPLNDANGQYNTSDGKVCATTTVTPGYDNTVYSDLVVSIPHHEVENINQGMPLYGKVRAYTSSGFLAGEGYVQVGDNNNGSTSSAPVYHDDNCYQCNNTRKCSNCGGRGTVYNPVGQGRYVVCYSCNGSGRCSFCQ